MPDMENTSRSNKFSQSRPTFRQKQSGYEPSDTETDWKESPWHGGLLITNRSKIPDSARTFRSKTPDPFRIVAPISSRSKTPDPSKTISPLNRSRRFTSKADNDSSRTSPVIRRHSRSPYKLIRQGDDSQAVLRRNSGPLKVSEHRSKNISPYRPRREEANNEINEHEGSLRKRNQRSLSTLQYSEDTGAPLQAQDIPRMSERSRLSDLSKNIRSRSISAPKPRVGEKQQETRPSLLAKTTTHEESEGVYANTQTQYEPNETIANMKLAKSPSTNYVLMQSTDSISLGDIFISRIGAAPKEEAIQNTDSGSKHTQQLSRGTGSFNQTSQVVTVSTVLSQASTSSHSPFAWMNNGRSTNYSGKSIDISGKLSGSIKKFTINRQKRQPDTWLSCVRRGSCMKSKSPESRAIDEASFIERALVVEELRPFLADKHSPCSLSRFICHKQQAQYLKQLVRIVRLGQDFLSCSSIFITFERFSRLISTTLG